MKKVIGFTAILLILVVIGVKVSAQDYQYKRNANATILRMNGSRGTEEKLSRTYISFSNYTRKLEVKSPWQLMDEPIDNSGINHSYPLTYDLYFNLDADKMRDNVASGKTFSTYGMLALNDVSKNVFVQYSSLPANVHNPCKFKISLMLEINPADFNLRDNDTAWIVMISDATINGQ